MAVETVKIIHNATNAKVVEPSTALKMWFSDQLSYSVKGHEHMKGNSNWDGRSSFFQTSSGNFPAGFVRLITKRLQRQGHRVIVRCVEPPLPIGPEHPKVDNYAADPRYSYQDDVVERLVALKGMIAQVATGGGKSRIFKLCSERIGRPTLFVTTRKSLMYQMAEDCEKHLKKPVGYMGDGKWSPKNKGINFAIIDTLAQRLNVDSAEKIAERIINKEVDNREAAIAAVLKKKNLNFDTSRISKIPQDVCDEIAKVRKAGIARFPIDKKAIKKKAKAKHDLSVKKRDELLKILANVEFVCLEEAHEVSSDSYYAVMKACKNAHYRLALTATPFMKDDEEANMRLMAVTGPIGIRVTEKDLIDKGILAKPYFLYDTLDRPPKVYNSSEWPKAEKMGIVENQQRNDKIVAHCVEAKQYSLPAMVLIQKVTHGKKLKSAMESAGLRVVFVSGKDDQAARASALKQLENGTVDVVIGSTIFDVGVDVPAVGLVVLAGGGKAEVSLRQRIGRGLRAKKVGANVCFIVDFRDGYNKHLAKHAKQRRDIISDTPGFAENVVESFDYAGFGMKKAA